MSVRLTFHPLVQKDLNEILYRETPSAIRVMVLKHVKRAPGFGLRRR